MKEIIKKEIIGNFLIKLQVILKADFIEVIKINNSYKLIIDNLETETNAKNIAQLAMYLSNYKNIEKEYLFLKLDIELKTNEPRKTKKVKI